MYFLLVLEVLAPKYKIFTSPSFDEGVDPFWKKDELNTKTFCKFGKLYKQAYMWSDSTRGSDYAAEGEVIDFTMKNCIIVRQQANVHSNWSLNRRCSRANPSQCALKLKFK
jgi:hypothetical protein